MRTKKKRKTEEKTQVEIESLPMSKIDKKSTNNSRMKSNQKYRSRRMRFHFMVDETHFWGKV